MGIQAILRRLFPDREHRLPPEKVRGEVIRCHDCRQLGYIVYERNGTYTMTKGWRMADFGLYICPRCQQSRRQIIKRRSTP